MAKNSITDYSKTAASNTDIQSVDIAEGCLPSGINNAIREIMADLADMNDGTVSLTSPSFAAASITGALTSGSATVGSTASSAAVHSYTKLEVESSSHTALQLSGSTGGEQWIWFADDSSSTPVGGITYYHGGPYMAFRVEGSERMRIDSSGNVGIGATPPSGVRTKIKGLAEATNLATSATSAALFIEPYSASSWGLGIGSISGQIQYIQGVSAAGDSARQLSLQPFGGNVGIGTSSPSAKLTVSGSVRALRTDDNTQYGDLGQDSSGGFITTHRPHASLYENFRFLASNNSGTTERMRIDSNGNVGIGTSSPAVELHINDASGLSAIRLTGGASGADNFQIMQGVTGVSNSGLSIYDVDATATRMVIDSSGQVGIGTTSPSTTLTIDSGGTPTTLKLDSLTESSIDFDDKGGSPKRYKIGTNISSNDGQFEFKDMTANAERMRITSDGDIQFPLATDAMGNFADNISEVGDGNFALQITNTAQSALKPFGIRAEDIRFATGSSERMRIDSSGNVGIGTSSPSQKLDVRGAGARIYLNDANEDIDMNSAADGQLRLDGSGYAGAIALNTAGMNIYTNASSRAIIFGVNETERMRIDTSGNVLVGTASTDMLGNDGLTLNGVGFLDIARSGNLCLRLTRKNTNGHIADFRRASVTVGYINVTTTGTSYVTSSDYRLKENVTGITGGIERVKQLNPSRFNFIADADTTVDGFLAHEAATVVPEAVTGEKDAVDADGNPEYQGIDQAKLVPLLTAALQEAITKIEDLEARVATLEGN